MISRRLLLASFLVVPSAARADTLIYRFGNWYRIPGPGGYDDEGDGGSTVGRIRRPPRVDETDPDRGGDGSIYDPGTDDPRAEEPRVDAPGAGVDGDSIRMARAREEAIARASTSPIRREVVRFEGYAPGTIVISTTKKRLFLVLDDGASALRYGVGVGREGFSWKGTETISAKREWPDWTPPAEMRARDPKLPVHMDGGLENPLGARALYLGETLYRIHGTNQPSSIGKSVSSGCIRLANADIIDLYERVTIGATVVVS